MSSKKVSGLSLYSSTQRTEEEEAVVVVVDVVGPALPGPVTVCAARLLPFRRRRRRRALEKRRLRPSVRPETEKSFSLSWYLLLHS